MPYYTRRMVKFIKSKGGKKEHSTHSSRQLRTVASNTAVVPSAEPPIPASVAADPAFDEKTLRMKKKFLEREIKLLLSQKASLSITHRYWKRYVILDAEGVISESAVCSVFKAKHNEYADNVLAVKVYRSTEEKTYVNQVFHYDPHSDTAWRVIIDGSLESVLPNNDKRVAPISLRGADGLLNPISSLGLKIITKFAKSHPNIIQTWNVFADETSQKVYVFQEFANRGSMDKYLSEKNGGVDERQAGVWSWQVVKALDYLGNHGISHRQIRPHHLLLSHRDLRVKLTGFHNSVIYWSPVAEDVINIACVQKPEAPQFDAPEMYGNGKSEEFDPINADVWSFGATIFAMLTNTYPYVYETVSDASKIGKQIEQNCANLKSVSFQCQSLLSQMLALDTNERIQFEKLESNQWLKKHR